MKKHELVFAINDSEKIVATSTKSFNKIHCCSEGSILFLDDSHKIVLTKDSIRENITILVHLLSDGLNNQLPLHPSIVEDIGYLYNQELQEQPGLAYRKWQGMNHWVGHDYLMWSYTYATWLYNDSSGSIVLEITPNYPGNFATPDTIKNFMPYEQWIQSYSPYLIRTILPDHAQQWLEQANRLLDNIQKNTEKEFNIQNLT